MKPQYTPSELSVLANEHATQLSETVKSSIVAAKPKVVCPAWTLLKKSLLQSHEQILRGHIGVLEKLESDGNWSRLLEVCIRREYARHPLKKHRGRRPVPHCVAAIRSAFDYDKFCTAKEYSAHTLAAKVKHAVCPYCNISLIPTIPKTDDAAGLRPAFDHWKPLSKHPWFSLSFYNLIPSCTTCNSGYKHEKEMKYTDHAHPYVDCLDDQFQFTLSAPAATYRGEVIVTPDTNIPVVVDIEPRAGILVTRYSQSHSLMELMSVCKRYTYCKAEVEGFLTRRNAAVQSRMILLKADLNIADASKLRECQEALLGTNGMNTEVHKIVWGKFQNDMIRQYPVW